MQKEVQSILDILITDKNISLDRRSSLEKDAMRLLGIDEVNFAYFLGLYRKYRGSDTESKQLVIFEEGKEQYLQKNIIGNIKINDHCNKIYGYCIKNLKKYSKYFTHGLGHGIGVEIHELPNLTLESKDKIMRNMVFTIEPGIYIPKKFGIRIEDSVLIGKKVDVLTKVTKDLLII